MLDTLAVVEAGEADAAATNNFFGGRMAGQYGLLETPVTFDHTSLHFATPGEHGTELLATIDRYLTEWKADSTSPYYDAMLKAITPARATVAPRWIYSLGLIAVLVTVVSLAVALLLRERLRAQARKLLRSGQRLEHLLASSPVILFSLRGPGMRLEWVSGNVERILAFPRKTVMDPQWWEQQIHPEDRRTAVRLNQRIFSENHLTQEYRVYDAHGKLHYFRDERRLVPFVEKGEEATIIGSWTDMTDEHERQQQLQFLSNYDPKTGLPNRTLLIDRLDQAVRRAKRRNSETMVILIDLDRFKHINDTLGMSIGDQVLIRTAEHLSNFCGEGNTVARIGSDEFCLVIETTPQAAQPDRLLTSLMAVFSNPLSAGDHELSISMSIGAAVFPEDGDDREQLMAAAELALDAAKRAGGNRHRFFERHLGEQTGRRLLLENELRRALDNNELELHFQPQFLLADRSICAMEALVRWNRPGHGMVPPGEFIPLAEETGLIERIDQWVLTEACRYLQHWEQQGNPVARVAVNMSAREFYNEALVDVVRKALSDNVLEGARLEIEITETMLMEFPERALKVLRQLETLGVRLSMDDFGSGYSNLAFIRRLPLHQLKIDQTLTQEIEHSSHNRSIIQAIIAMTKALELELVAEGIETEAQFDFLKQSGCRIGQGFLLGRPTPGSLIGNLLAHDA